MPLSMLAEAMAWLENGRPLVVSRLSDLPADSISRRVYEQRPFAPHVVLPLTARQEISAVLVLRAPGDEYDWPPSLLTAGLAVAGIVANALSRQQAELAAAAYREQLQTDERTAAARQIRRREESLQEYARLNSRLEARSRFDAFNARISEALIRLTPAGFDEQLEAVLESIRLEFGADAVAIYRHTRDDQSMRVSHEATRPGLAGRKAFGAFPTAEMAPLVELLAEGSGIILNSLDDVPEGARKWYADKGFRPAIALPVQIDSRLRAGLVITVVRDRHHWDPALLPLSRHLASALGHALARGDAEREARTTRDRLAEIERQTAAAELRARERELAAEQERGRQLAERERYARLTTDIATALVYVPGEAFDEQVEQALAMLREQTGALAAVIARVSPDRQWVSATHESLGPGEFSRKALEPHAAGPMLPLYELFRRRRMVVREPSELPASPGLRAAFAKVGFKPRAMFAMSEDERIMGVLSLTFAPAQAEPSPSAMIACELVAHILSHALSRREAEVGLTESREQLRALAARLAEVRDSERTRFARELHDALGQTFSGLAFTFDGVQEALTRRQVGAAKKQVASARAQLQAGVQEVQRLAAALRPGVLDHFGLAAAIEFALGEFSEQTGLATHFQADIDAAGLPEKSALTLYRICQEALTNVGRHAQASEVTVSLARQGEELVLTVTDDGAGFTAAEARAGLGLLGMQERALMHGGATEITSKPGQGTRVCARLPWPRNREATP